MRTITSISELRQTLDEIRFSEEADRRVGFVPTMGYLHDGHVSLIEHAARTNDHVIVSLFVNPLQFAQNEDLGTYPRDPDGDAAKAETAGAQILFCPDPSEMYPLGQAGVLTTVAVPELAGVMEGASRPTHFAGVCTVVAKLFNLVGPCSAYFGEKDYQQLAIIRQMALDLSFPVDVIGCPTVREPDGLAMSSRNVYLSDDERRVAPALNAALRAGAQLIREGETSRGIVLDVMTEVIASQSLGTLDYFEITDPLTLFPAHTVGPDCRIFGALRFSRARLIDNISASLANEVVDA
ncbi:MAG: pantoate--beta-alanine ligase [Microthrixaceae bacterium]